MDSIYERNAYNILKESLDEMADSENELCEFVKDNVEECKVRIVDLSGQVSKWMATSSAPELREMQNKINVVAEKLGVVIEPEREEEMEM